MFWVIFTFSEYGVWDSGSVLSIIEIPLAKPPVYIKFTIYSTGPPITFDYGKGGIDMTIEERFEILEKELAAAKRLIHRLMFGAGLVLGMCVLFVAVHGGAGVAHGQTGERVIRAKRFMVEDDQGRIRAGLYVDEDGPKLFLSDENGKVRACMGVFKNVPNLYLYDEKGAAPLAGLYVWENRPCLVLWDNNRQILWSVLP